MTTNGAKCLPHDALEIVVPIERDCGTLSKQEIAAVVQCFNKYGACVLRPRVPIADRTDATNAFCSLAQLFGQPLGHEKMRGGMVIIDPKTPNSIGVATVSHPHEPHTDEAYADCPSRVMTLHCRVPARSGGGESVIVCGKRVLDAITTEEFTALSKRGAVVIGRKLKGEAKGKQTDHPLFSVNDQGRIDWRWRSLDTYVLSIAPDAKDAVHRINHLAQTQRLVIPLQAGDTLVCDNRAVAHGRLPYEAGEDRIFWRVNYDGNGALRKSLVFGSAPADIATSVSSAAPRLPRPHFPITSKL